MSACIVSWTWYGCIKEFIASTNYCARLLMFLHIVCAYILIVFVHVLDICFFLLTITTWAAKCTYLTCGGCPEYSAEPGQ